MRRVPLAVALLAGLAAPGWSADFAELELVGSAISRADGAPAVFGYDPAGSPDLVTSEDAEVPLGLHGNHEDARFDRTSVYRSSTRVNEGRSRGSGGTARGEIGAGHSIVVMSGWADAGSNALGASAEAHAGLVGESTAAGIASARIEKRITIQPGSSGLAPGTLVTGLAWDLEGRGLLRVAGITHPGRSASGAGADLDLLVLRGPTGTCGAFDCPRGALAVAANLLTTVYFQAQDPASAGGRTGRLARHRSWSASNNAGPLKAGAVFESGSDDAELGLPITDEGVTASGVEAVDTADEPLALDAIEFEANVGETLRVVLELDASGSLDGSGYGEADFFDSFSGRPVDPLARGLVFESSVPVPEPPRAALLAVAALALALRRRGERRRRGDGRRGGAELRVDAAAKPAR